MLKAKTNNFLFVWKIGCFDRDNTKFALKIVIVILPVQKLTHRISDYSFFNSFLKIAKHFAFTLILNVLLYSY